MKTKADEALLGRLGLDFQVLDSGCCGMAGAFGFEHGERYDVSIKAGERVLLPAVRGAPKDALIIADGFSCREQIDQVTDRHALHLAQVMQMGLREGPSGPEGRYPETHYAEPRTDSRRALAVVGATGAAFVASVLLWALAKRRR